MIESEWFLKVKKINPEGKINKPAFFGDAGYDVFATETIIIEPKKRYNMSLGLGLEFPNNYVCLVQQKSGNSIKKGFTTIGNVIDSNYRGEIHAIIANITDTNIEIIKGEKVAQLIFVKISTPDFVYVENLNMNTSRKTKGFGSTGNK